MAVDFTEKAKRYQAIDEIIASGRKLKWDQIVSELNEVYDLKTSKSAFFRDIKELQEKYQAPIDTDFETPVNYFKQSQETYLVQTLDILTIQPLTAFLRELKARNILEEKKLRVILNKVVKIRGINEKTIIGGMAYYNDPAMSFMTELFDRSLMKYISLPFEEETYIKYLENIIECNISLKGYSKAFMQSLKALSNMVYPTTNSYTPPNSMNNGTNNTFSPNINNTLNQMKNNY